MVLHPMIAAKYGFYSTLTLIYSIAGDFNTFKSLVSDVMKCTSDVERIQSSDWEICQIPFHLYFDLSVEDFQIYFQIENLRI